MNWFFPDDHSEPTIQARHHARSEHRGETLLTLPQTAVLFFMGGGTAYLQAHYPTQTLTEMLPRFLWPTPVYTIQGRGDVCFLDGGRGAPQAVDTVETIAALGVKKMILVGLCGCFADEIGLFETVLPPKILVEEGASHHYHRDITFAQPHPQLYARALALFQKHGRVWERPTVTTDAVYRQTLYKEALWREQGCVGVDMEASAVLSVSQYLGLEAVALLLVSDKHPTPTHPEPWSWGLRGGVAQRDDYLQQCLDFALTEGQILPAAR